VTAEIMSIQASFGVSKTALEAAKALYSPNTRPFTKNLLTGLSGGNFLINVWSFGINYEQTRKQWHSNNVWSNTRNVIGMADGPIWAFNDAITIASRYGAFDKLSPYITRLGALSGYSRIVSSTIKWGPGIFLQGVDACIFTYEAGKVSSEVYGYGLQDVINQRYGFPSSGLFDWFLK